MIDQCTLGFRFVKDELRSCSQPAVAWQLDLFGHGREINSLFAQVSLKNKNSKIESIYLIRWVTMEFYLVD
jgi:hypothetical protein